jgi:hypothetical protein
MSNLIIKIDSSNNFDEKKASGVEAFCVKQANEKNKVCGCKYFLIRGSNLEIK